MLSRYCNIDYDREMAIGTYGRGIYVCDIGPIKEFKPELFQENAHLFDIKDTIRWNRFERRGDALVTPATMRAPSLITRPPWPARAPAVSTLCR
jgi:hypothetical protein